MPTLAARTLTKKSGERWIEAARRPLWRVRCWPRDEGVVYVCVPSRIECASPRGRVVVSSQAAKCGTGRRPGILVYTTRTCESERRKKKNARQVPAGGKEYYNDNKEIKSPRSSLGVQRQ